jgi:aldehyde dehydrogenase (NAD+)
MTTTPRRPADPETGTQDLARTFAEYVPSLEGRDILTIRPRYGLVIDGEERPARDGGEIATIEPATGEALAVVAEGGPADVDDAVAAARRAFEDGWRDLPGRARAKYLFRLARLVQDRSRELAVLESIDGGKPIRESRDIDVPLVAAHLFYHAGWADKLEYAAPGMAARPLGVVGQIIPWNFPLLMAAWKIAPALACGNTVVLKPAETTPLTALLLAELIHDAGFPPGVVNVVTGAGETGAALAAHPGVDKVAFTGSTEVGKAIRRALAGTGRRLTLELGGKGAHLVFDDAALDQAVEGIVDGIFFNQGHVCCAGSRLLVQEGVADDLLARLRRRVELLRVGDPLDKNTDVGAINSSAQLERIRGYVDGAAAAGCRVDQPERPLPERGFFFPPTIVSGVGGSEAIAREEVFGPVLTVQTFRTEAEGVAKANATRYGLSAGVWTEKGSRILWVSQRLRAGVVWANTFNRFDPASPFGGVRESGFGREGGRQGLAEYLELEPLPA